MDYLNKLNKIKEKERSLLEEKVKITERRKLSIAKLAEKFDLLSLPDEVVAAAFNEIKQEVDKKTNKLGVWKEQGQKLIKKRRQKKPLEENQSA